MSGETKLLLDNNGDAILPSIVHCDKDGMSVGSEALSFITSDPVNTISSIKRFMGISFTEAKAIKNLPYDLVDREGSVVFKTAMGELSPVEISGRILSSLKRRAEDALGDELKGVVITVPAYFNDAQRQSTKDAAKLAGINVSRP
jgi:molecular chaperone HscA